MTEDATEDKPDTLPEEHPSGGFAPTYHNAAHHRSKKYFVVIPMLLIVAAVGFGGFIFLKSKKAAKIAPSSSLSENASEAKPTASKDIPNAAGTQIYENGSLGVKLTYPKEWIAKEGENKDSVKLESPTFSYQTTSKGNISGNFRLYIRKGARDIDSKYIGRSYAIQPSEKLVYSQPAVGQRADTNLSLFGLDTPDNFALMLIAGNFNLKKGDSLGPTYGKEAETFIIAGGFSSPELKDDLATNPVSVEAVQTSNAYKQAIDILRSLQLH